MKRKTATASIKKKTTTQTEPSPRAAEPPSEETAASASPATPVKTKRSTVRKLKSRIVSAFEAVTAPVKTKRAGKPKIGGASRREKIQIPAIMLEGDRPSPSPVSGPGQKYALGPVPPAQQFETTEAELPNGYGTRQLFLTARDPHWLYAHWDLTHEQQTRCNTRSADGHLVLRVYAHKIEGHPINEIHVHPESRHWFAHVERAGDAYAAELGYYSPVGKWVRVAASAATLTPPDAVSPEGSADFATIPFEFPFARLLEIIKAAVHENLPLAQALEELRRQGHRDLPRAALPLSSAWTPEQERALAKIINIDDVRRVWMGSLEITELIRRRLAHDISSMGASAFGISSISSPFGGVPPRGFWFNVNAELIIYGATEPAAKVTLGGHEIKLRPDGSFSYRFALPDGKYDLPAVAVSTDGTEARAADLKFSRATEYLGEVGAHPQDPSLKAPLPENV
ncbi:MAG TPA: DUF4912 domain-containing protein [Candidatus Limnocylindrales bacterium]|nr:DUF4912 domain-containing protein [Candidatus Limnocylindrales bacterium]